MHLVPAAPSVKVPNTRSRAGKGTGAHSVFSREKVVVSHTPIPLKSSLKHSVAELCNVCGVVHNVKCKCEFREGNKAYTPNDGIIAASKSLLCRTDGLSIVPEAEIFPIPSDNRGRNDFEQNNGWKMMTHGSNFFGNYADFMNKQTVCIEESTRYCRPEDIHKRDAIACRKANELASEVGRSYNVPVAWDETDGNSLCIILTNHEMKVSNDNKSYFYSTH